MKKNLRTSLFALSLAATLIFSMMLTGCKAEAPAAPDEVLKGVYDLLLKDDATKICDLFGYATKEEAQEDLIGDSGDFRTEILDGLVVEMQDMGLEMTPDELAPLLDGTTAMLSKLEFDAEVAEIDEKAKTASVTAKITCYDPQAIGQMSEAITNDMLEKADMTVLATEEGFMNFMKEFLAEYAVALHTMEPTSEVKEFDVPFELEDVEINGKTKKMWIPVDANQFGQDLSLAALGS